MLLFAGLVFSGLLFSQARKDREQSKPVDVYFWADFSNRYPEFGEADILTGNVVFYHNGAVITCDSAVRYSDDHIDCFFNVIINKDSTFVYGDRAEYNGGKNLARVYSPIIKVINGSATLYTYNFTFNTLDNVGIYYGGGVMYQEDNVLESEKGYFYSDLNELVAVRDVEMKNDDYSVVSDSMRYNMDTKVVNFYTKTFIWTSEGEILTADRGRYNTQDSTYYFHGNAYVLTEFRETWADTIDFNARRNDAILYGNIQIDDNENLSSAFGDYGQYWGERGETMLTKLPSLLNYNEERNNSDTLYMRADTIFMFVIYPSDRKRSDSHLADADDPYAHLKWADGLTDSARLSIADSLRPVISRLRAQADDLRLAADSIMNALYPPVPAVETHSPVETPPVVGDTLPDHGSALRETEEGSEEALSAEEAVQEETPDSGSRRRDRRRGPYPEPWIFRYLDTLPDETPAIVRPDSLAFPLPPTDMATDSLSRMEKIRELLPPELSGEDASTLLEMLDGSVPEGMSHLVSDSIDVSALRSVIGSAAEAEPAVRVREPEPAVPEKREPPEVAALRARAAELTAEADSLQVAETYIRPKLRPAATENGLPGSPDLVAAADSIATSAVHTDSLSMDKKAMKKFEKQEKRRLKAERKAEKARLKTEKRAAKDAQRAAKDAERRRRLFEKGRLADTLPALDSLSAADSLRLPDSILLARTDSLEMPREGTVSEPDSTERIFRGWRNVKIWRSDMQAVCDSIVGFSRDSTVRMYINPILWQGDSQIVADSMILHMSEGNLDFAEFFGNPIMSLKISENQFNQATGRTMTSRFRDNEVYRHDIYGNAEAFYYIQEDEKDEEGNVKGYSPPVAVIVATSSNMTFYIKDQFIDYIVAREQVDWPVYPVDQIPVTQPTELKGFRWYGDRRPELKDVFDRIVRPAEREFHESLELPRFPVAARINRRREYLIENRMWVDRVDPLPAHAIDHIESLRSGRNF